MRINRTMQRQAIREELCKLTCHPTADELYEIVRQRIPQISLGTVYRNLEQLSMLGIIRKLEVAGKQKRFDGNAAPHHHLRCRECGAVIDLWNKELGELDKCLSRMLSVLDCENVAIEFQGLCPECRKSKSK